jgi:uncharacterized damage-inducible protein DinB
MNDGLVDAFRHNTWATRQVLQVCQGLTESQLQETTPGTYGSIIATLWHIVRSEASYCRRLTGEEPTWDWRAKAMPGIAVLADHVDDLAARWERFLAQPFDADRTFAIEWDNETDYSVPAGVVLVQALHHGNEHRTQVCTVLTSIGVTAPALGVWEFAEATQRATPRKP